MIVNLKRRENDFKDMAIELLKRFKEDIGEVHMKIFHGVVTCRRCRIIITCRIKFEQKKEFPHKEHRIFLLFARGF